MFSSYLKEIDENLFNLPRDIPVAHCIAEDLRMGAGIAVKFKYKYHAYALDQINTDFDYFLDNISAVLDSYLIKILC
jgi:hypothetical protein